MADQAQKFSLAAQVEEVDREIAQRRGVYARLVSVGKMRQSIADYQIARMEAVKRTLEWLRDIGEEDLRAFVRSKRQPTDPALPGIASEGETA